MKSPLRVGAQRGLKSRENGPCRHPGLFSDGIRYLAKRSVYLIKDIYNRQNKEKWCLNIFLRRHHYGLSLSEKCTCTLVHAPPFGAP
jgi:hypothetical protein